MSQDDVIRQAFANLESDNVTTRIEAIQTLGRLKVSDAVSALVALLPDSIFGPDAADALVAIGSASVRDDVVLFQNPGFSAAKGASVVADEKVRILRMSPDREWAYIRTDAGAEGWVWAAMLGTPTTILDPIPRQEFQPQSPGSLGRSEAESKKEAKADEEPEKGRLQDERRRGIPRELMEEAEAEFSDFLGDDEPSDVGGAAEESELEEAAAELLPSRSTSESTVAPNDGDDAVLSGEKEVEKPNTEEPVPPPPLPDLGGLPPRPQPQPFPITTPAKPPEPKPAEAEAAPSADQTVQLSAYYPKEAAPNVWLPLRAYIYRALAAPQVAADASRFLGDAISSFRRAEDTARTAIEEGALVAAIPELSGFQINPPSLSVLFLEDWHRFEFKLRATTAPLDQAANGHITFTVEGIIVADIPLSIFASASATTPDVGGGSLPPTMQANVTSATTKPYQSIFCSYSHKDTWIVERVERAYKALGMDFLRDVVKLKSGQDWNAELLGMIDRADIFQLFWSSNAMQSQYVRQEWEYALKRGTGRVSFIRPVYWEEPMPNVPPELGHIHFAFQPELDD